MPVMTRAVREVLKRSRSHGVSRRLAGERGGARGWSAMGAARWLVRGLPYSMAAVIGEMGCGVDANQRENAKAAINVEVCGGYDEEEGLC